MSNPNLPNYGQSASTDGSSNLPAQTSNSASSPAYPAYGQSQYAPSPYGQTQYAQPQYGQTQQPYTQGTYAQPSYGQPQYGQVQYPQLPPQQYQQYGQVATQQPYGQVAQMAAPVTGLKTNRGLLKFLVLSFLTLDIYGAIRIMEVGETLNLVAGRYDGKRTTNYILVWLFGAFTLFIWPLVWFHKISARMGNELVRRGYPASITAASFWLWCFLGSFIIFLGPLVYLYKFLHGMNTLCADYNRRGQ